MENVILQAHKKSSQNCAICRDSTTARPSRNHILLVVVLVIAIERRQFEDEDENEDENEIFAK